MKLEFDPQADAAYLEISDAEVETTRHKRTQDADINRACEYWQDLVGQVG